MGRNLGLPPEKRIYPQSPHRPQVGRGEAVSSRRWANKEETAMYFPYYYCPKLNSAFPAKPKKKKNQARGKNQL